MKIVAESPNCWVFVVRDQRIGATLLEARDILQNRMRHGFWAFGPHARGAHRVRPGDQAVIYLSSRTGGGFVGTCRVQSSLQPLAPKLRRLVLAGEASGSVAVADFAPFPELVPVPDVARQLQFVRNKAHWGAYLQGSAIRIPAEDYAAIVQATGRPGETSPERCPPHVWSYETIPMHGEAITLTRCIVCGAQQRDQ